METQNTFVPTSDDLQDVLEQIESVDNYTQTILDQDKKQKFICNSAKLLQTINKVLPIMNSKTNIDNTISIYNNCIFVKDAHNSVLLPFQHESDFDGFSVDGKLLISTLSNLVEQPITFYIDHVKKGLEILSDNGRYSMEMGEPITRTKDNYEEIFEVKAKYFLSPLENLIDFTSKNEMLPALHNIYVNYADGTINYFATNGLFVKRTKEFVEFEKSFEFLLPAITVERLNRLVSDENEMLNITYSDKQIIISGKDFNLFGKLDDYHLPKFDYHKKVFNFGNVDTVRLNRKDLLKNLKVGLIYSNKKQKTIRLQFHEEGRLDLIARDLDFGNQSTQFLPYFGGISKELVVLNIDQLTTILSSFESEEVEFVFDGMKPVRINDADVDSNFEYAVIVPQRLEEYKSSMF